MPRTQTANTGVYDFGAPVTEDTVLQFKARHGGRLTMRFENYGDSDLEVTVEVAPDASTWADTTAAANNEAVANVTILPRTYQEFDVLLRDGQDSDMRVLAVGGVRGMLQLRGDEALIVDKV